MFRCFQRRHDSRADAYYDYIFTLLYYLSFAYMKLMKLGSQGNACSTFPVLANSR